jgi:hypothetical protein
LGFENIKAIKIAKAYYPAQQLNAIFKNSNIELETIRVNTFQDLE